MAILIAAGLVGCAPDIEKRGDLPEKDALAQIHPGSTTRDQVAKLLGSPSSAGIFDANSWYYISRETRQVSFFDPKVLDQQVYVVNFDGNGVVASVQHKTLRDAQAVPMAPGATPAPGRELTVVEQLIGNIGRFSGGGGGGEESTSSSPEGLSVTGPATAPGGVGTR